MTSPDVVSLLICRVSGRLIGLPVEHVIETMRPLPVEALGGGPSHVTGLSIIRGAPVPVVSVGRLLGDDPAQPTRYVTIMVRERIVALAVDGVVGLRGVPAGSLDALPPLLRDAAGEAVSAIARLDAELLLVLQSGRLIPDDLSTLMVAGGDA